MRTAADDLAADAADALLDVLRETGVARQRQSEVGGTPDLVVTRPDGSRLVFEVKAGAVPTPAQARRMTNAGTSGHADLGVFVGDELSPAVRRTLEERGWGWFDRRGHLQLRLPARGVVIDSDVRPVDRARSVGPKAPVRGRGGLAYAFAALMHPDDTPSVRQVARTMDLAPSSVSAGRKALMAASLLRQDGTALVPELFWALEEAWRPQFVALERSPHPDGEDAVRLDLELGEPQRPGWALTDTLAAIAWGAPLVAPGSYPPDFYVPSGQSLRRAIAILGEARSFQQRGASVAVAPLPVVTAPRFDHGSKWFLAHPLVVALDLAHDPSRGREALDAWDPQGVPGFRRVW
ncbi:MAG TPA: hypothetical protein VFF40_07445 [Acidimicrobiia bacterium]|nr:hypothetical protein [Acidimicrobiia bacterium]